ncbi:MAG: hypothetical protein ACRDPT_03105 [Streptomycetales bacterium]
MLGWPIVVTNRCADSCLSEFGLADRESARGWLYDLIAKRGQVTAELPPPMQGRRSPSGYFCLIDGMLVLPLAADRDGRAQWIATNCLAFPDYRRRYGTAAQVDPFTLAGPALLAQVNFTDHAVRRFQERCAAHPDPSVAARQLVATLAPVAQAVPRPPAWCRTQPADFYLVAGDEFCLPMSRHGSGGKAFDAKTCIHRASDLFQLRGPALAAACRIGPGALPDTGATTELDHAFVAAGSLSWTPPRWAPREPRARFWVLFSPRLVAPVAWEPDASRPLVLLSLVRRRSLWERIRTRLRACRS